LGVRLAQCINKSLSALTDLADEGLNLRTLTVFISYL